MPPPPPCAEKISVFSAKYQAIKSCLNEKGKRLWAAVEAASYGRGGFNAVCIATGLSKRTLSITHHRGHFSSRMELHYQTTTWSRYGLTYFLTVPYSHV